MRKSQIQFVAHASLVSLVVLGAATQALAQLPVARLTSIYPAGGKQGTTVEITIGGDNLEGAGTLHFSAPGITAEQKTQPPGLGQEGPQPVPGQFTLTIAPDAPLGICEVRASGKYGISNPRAFVIDSRDELVEQEPNNSIEQATAVPLGTIVNGQSNSGSDQDYYKFTAKAGERVIIDCWAYRIDSRMDPSLVLFDAQGTELDRSRDANRRDPMIDFTVPADGDYYVEVHDFLYGGSREYYYRLQIGTGAHLDFALPPAGLPGSNESYTLYGRNLPGGQPTELLSEDGKPLESLQVQIALPDGDSARQLEFEDVIEPEESAIDGMVYRLATPSGLSNGILIGYATAPITLEQEPNDDPTKAQKIEPGCEVAARFLPQPDRDWYTFDAKAGQVLWIEVISQRLGLPTDPALVIQQVTKNDKGEEQIKDIAAVDDYLDNPNGQTRRGMAIYDMRTDDPATRFVAPADGTYRLQVHNLASYTDEDPRLVYRLAVREEQPDFRLVAKPRLLPHNNNAAQNPPTVWSPLLRKGGTEIFDVVVFRRDGFSGPVEVSVEGLPAGVTAAPISIGPGQDVGQLVLVAAEDAPAGESLVKVVGKARIGEQDVTHVARAATMISGGQVNAVTPRSRLSRNLAVAVSGEETAPFLVDAGNTVLEDCPAGKVQVPVKVVRRGDFKGTLTLTPFPVPPGVKPPSLTLDEKTAEGKMEFALAANTPPGTYSLQLTAATTVSYARNPEAVTQAQARKEAVDKIAAELAAAAKAATEAKAAAEAKTTEATAALNESKAAADAAAKALAEAQAKADAAAKAAADAEAQMKAAAEAKAAAEKAAAEAEAKAKQAAETQKAVDKQLADAQAAAKPKNLNVAAPSTIVTIRVADAPFAVELTPPAAVKPGTTVEVPVKVTRKFGFAGEVPLEVKLAGDAAGLKVAGLTLPADQSEAKLSVEIAADAKPGTYAIDVLAKAKFRDQDFSKSHSLPITIEAAASE